MLENLSTSLAAGGAALILIFLLTIPSIIGIISHLRSSKFKSDVYEDKDGIATTESVSAYSAKLPKIFLAIFTTSGLFLSIALAVLGTLNDDGMFIENWLNAAQWVRSHTRDDHPEGVLTDLASSTAANMHHRVEQGFRQKL